jgi:hypothetical protein
MMAARAKGRPCRDRSPHGGYDTMCFGMPLHAVIGYRALLVDFSETGAHGKNGFDFVGMGQSSARPSAGRREPRSKADIQASFMKARSLAAGNGLKRRTASERPRASRPSRTRSRLFRSSGCLDRASLQRSHCDRCHPCKSRFNSFGVQKSLCTPWRSFRISRIAIPLRFLFP